MDTGIIIRGDIPGGNIIVDKISGNHVKLRQNYENSSTWWFWWCFAVEGAAGKIVTFEFTDKDVFSSLGPCCNDGAGWTFLGSDVVSNNSFSFMFPEDAGLYRFALSIPYTQIDLDRFLCDNPDIKREALTRTVRDRDVSLLSIISEQSKYNVLLTARHHACEVTANYVMEGIFEYWLQDVELCREVDLRGIPFADTDGVFNGDQGKNRDPHDHNRDYGPFDYEMPKAMIEQMPQWPRTVVALDLHNPSVKDTEIYFVGANQGQNKIDEFATKLKQEQEGTLKYSGSSDIPFGTGWNTGTLGLGCSSYLRDNKLAEMAATIEIPYAQAGENIMSPENLRQLGHDFGRSIKDYIFQNN